MLLQNKEMQFPNKLELLELISNKFDIKPCLSIGNAIPLTQFISLYGAQLDADIKLYANYIKVLLPPVALETQYKFEQVFHIIQLLQLGGNHQKINRNSDFLTFQA